MLCRCQGAPLCQSIVCELRVCFPRPSKDIFIFSHHHFPSWQRFRPQLDRNLHSSLSLPTIEIGPRICPRCNCCVRLAEVSARQLPRRPMGGGLPLVCSVVWGHLEGGTATGVAPFFSSSSVALESSILFFLLGRLSLRVESLLSIPAWPMGVGIDYPFFFFPAARQARTGTEKRS